MTALLPRIVKEELSTQSALAIWCSRSSDTYWIALTSAFLSYASHSYDKEAARRHEGATPSRSLLICQKPTSYDGPAWTPLDAASRT